MPFINVKIPAATSPFVSAGSPTDITETTANVPWASTGVGDGFYLVDQNPVRTFAQVQAGTSVAVSAIGAQTPIALTGLAADNVYYVHFAVLGPSGLESNVSTAALSTFIFTAADLFENDEPGVWFDPSDMSTMFQDASGQSPVTASGQSVALILDKSKGGAVGPDQIVNGDFALATDWTLSGATISGGNLNVSSGAFNNVAIQGYSGVTLSSLVRVSFEVTEATSGVIAFFMGGLNLASKVTPDISTVGSYSYIFQVLSGSGDFFFRAEVGGFSGVIDNISVEEILGVHALQPDAGRQPTYQVDGGKAYLLFDGVNDALTTTAVTPATDKVQIFAGVRKQDDLSPAILVELSSNVNANAGSFYITAPETTGAGGDYKFQSRGSVASQNVAAPALAGADNYLTALGDVSGSSKIIRLDGVEIDSDVQSQGTGNYLAYPLYIGGRDNTSLYFGGRIYSLIIRFGDNLTPEMISGAESHTQSKL